MLSSSFKERDKPEIITALPEESQTRAAFAGFLDRESMLPTRVDLAVARIGGWTKRRVREALQEGIVSVHQASEVHRRVLTLRERGLLLYPQDRVFLRDQEVDLREIWRQSPRTCRCW